MRRSDDAVEMVEVSPSTVAPGASTRLHRLKFLFLQSLTNAEKGSLSRFFVLASANLGTSVLGFLLVIVVIRAYGAGALGEFSFGLTVTAYATVIGTIGTEYHAIKLVSESKADLRVLVPSVILLRFATSVPIYLCIVISAYVFATLAPYREVLVLLGLSIIVNALNVIWLPQGRHSAWLVALCSILPPLLTIIMAVASAAEGFGIEAFAAGKVAADLFVTILLLWLVRHQLRHLDWHSGWRNVRHLAGASAPIGGSQMLRAVALSSDLVVLGFFVPAVGVGHYSAALRIFNLLLSIGTMYHLVIIPVFSKYADDHHLLSRELSGAIRHTLAGSMPVALLLCILAPFVLTYGFNAGFVDATLALQLLALAAVANVLSRPYRQILLTIGMQRTDFRLNAICSVLHVFLKVGLCYLFGLTGVAAGTALGEIAITLLTRRIALRGLSLARI